MRQQPGQGRSGLTRTTKTYGGGGETTIKGKVKSKDTGKTFGRAKVKKKSMRRLGKGI